MSLDDRQLERYARQVIIPGVGARGQQLLLASRVLVMGRDDGREIAADYLSRAGVGLASPDDETIDCAIVCDLESLTHAQLSELAACTYPVVCYTLAATTIHAGTYIRGEDEAPHPFHRHPPLPRPDTETSGSMPAVVRFAACDAAASAIAVLLEWTNESNTREFDLA